MWNVTIQPTFISFKSSNCFKCPLGVGHTPKEIAITSNLKAATKNPLDSEVRSMCHMKKWKESLII